MRIFRYVRQELHPPNLNESAVQCSEADLESAIINAPDEERGSNRGIEGETE